MKYTSTKGLIGLLLLMITSSVFGQSVPVGIGATSSPGLVYWLRGDLGVTNIPPVTQWSDQSGNGNDAIVGAGGPDLIVSAQMANQPVMSFAGDGLTIPNTARINTGTGYNGDEISMFVAFRTGTDVTTNQFIYDEGGSTNGLNVFVKGGNIYVNIYNSNASSRLTVFESVSVNTTYILSFRWNNGAFDAQLNGASMSGSTSNGSMTSFVEHGNDTGIGYNTSDARDETGSIVSAGQNFTGLIGEIIYYDNALSLSEENIIINYLAERYDVSLGGNDKYGTIPGFDSSFQVDYRGVGQEADGSVLSNSITGFYFETYGLSLDNGDYIIAAHDNTVNDEGTVADIAGSIEERWKRAWYVEKTGSVNAKLKFDLSEGISGARFVYDPSDYVLIYRATNSGAFSVVTTEAVSVEGEDRIVFDVANANFIDGYYTLGTTNLSQSPVIGVPGLTYYSMVSGDWNDPTIWTLDPSGALYDNPSSSYPNKNGDNVVIKSGRDITMNVNNVNCDQLTIEGVLYLGTSSGHSFSEIFGDGRVYMEADNFPAGDATHFASKNQGEGTVIFQGDGYAISNAHTFYDVEIELTNTASQITLLADLSVNNNLTFKTGELRINDDSQTTILNIDVKGNVDVEADASLTVGRGSTVGSFRINGSMPATGQYHNIFHQFIVNGDFINRGVVRLTNETAPRYNQFSLLGAVTLRMQGATNNNMSLYGTTDLYNLVIEKGVDKTYQLEVYADNQNYFRLFGANNVGRRESTPFSSSNPEVRKALWIHKGTLKLTGSIHIPTLTEGNRSGGNGDYAIGEFARMMIAGANVEVYSTAQTQSQIPGYEATAIGVNSNGSHSAMSLFGDFQIDDGVFNTRNSYGFVYWAAANPLIQINGGVVSVGRLYQVGSGPVSYIQTGGSLTVNDSHFDLSSEDAVFQMSGGEIEIRTGDFIVGSKEGNYGVTGGTVRFELNSNRNLNSTANLYNLVINSRSGNRSLRLSLPLVALNDINVNDNAFLDHRGRNVTIGRNFTIADGATNHGYSTSNNTLTFNGSEDATFYIGHPYTDGYELQIYNLTINKPEGKRLIIASSPEKKAPYVEANAPSNLWYARIIQVENDLRVESGILDQGDQAIRMYGPLYVGATGVCGVYEPATTHKDALVMIKDVVSITTETGAELGNVKMNPQQQNKIFDLTSDVIIKRISYHHGRMNLGAYNLKVDYIHKGGTLTPYEVSDGRESNEMFISDGNASDGGLSVLIHENGTYAYPIGVSGKYTPAEVLITDLPLAESGYLTIRPVQGELKTTELAGGDILDYYWRVGHFDFPTLPTVQYNFTYNQADVNGTEANYYPGKVLDEAPYTRFYEGDLTNVNTSSNIITFNDTQTTEEISGTPTVVSNTGTGFTVENANYTAGVAARFQGAPQVYYSIATSISSCFWTNGNSWARNDNLNPTYGNHDSRQNAAGSYPGVGDIAIIGWCPWNDGNGNIDPGDPHLIRLNSDIECAQLIFTPMEDVSGNPTARVPRYVSVFRPCLGIYNGRNLTTGIVQGEGMFWCKQSDPDFSLMDLGEFAVSDSSYILYENYDNNRTYNNIPNESPNLIMTTDNWGNNDRNTIIGSNIKTNGNFEILGDVNVQLGTGANGDITIGGDLLFFEVTDPASGNPSGGGGELRFQNSGSTRTIAVEGNVILNNTSNQIYVQNAGANNISHQIIVGGDIIQTSTGNGLLFSTNPVHDHINLTFNGDRNAVVNISNGQTPELHRLIISKGTGQGTSVTFNNDFNLNGATNGNSADKALYLQSGTLYLNDASIDINLTTGGENFNIPSSSALVLQSGAVVNANGTSGIYLDGQLTVENGTVNMHGGDNPIVYSASGNALITVNNGQLIVGGQIRRGTITDVGVLSYTQTGGVVRVGTSSATVNNRGVFEIIGSGSQFAHTGGTISIENAQTSASVAAFLLEPETSSIGTSTIYIGGVSTAPGQIIGINSSVVLNNLVVDNTSGNNPIAQQIVRSLTLNGNLQINANTQFDAVGLDLNIGGDLIADGTFISNSNSTYLNGASTQTIYGDINFYNLEKSGMQELVLNSAGANLDVDNNFVFNDGLLTANNNIIEVQRNVTFNGTHTVTGGNGIVLNGTLSQSLEGSGAFDVLTVNNAAGIDVPYGNELTINANLRLQQGVLNIDKNLLVISSGAVIEEVSPFSASNMIQTNISFTDNGVRKYFNTTPKTFIYPMGSGGKYTPVSIRVDSNTSSTGYVTVKAADERHPSVIDPTNVLWYHWILKSENMTGFTGEIRMNYDPNDVKLNGNSINDYIAARLLADGSGTWNKPFGIVDQTNDELVYTFGTAITSDEITGDYTAGVDAAIPDQVPSYISVKDGPWNDATTWDTYPTAGEGVPAGGPRGAIVIVDNATSVTVTANAISSYQTTINGTLLIGTTAAHRLGEVDGSGNLSAETGVMPAGVYDNFVSATGGTLTYTGSADYSVLGDLTSVNNLSFTGTGQRRLPNHENLSILGNLHINGASVVNNNDMNIILKQGLTFDSGSFDSGSFDPNNNKARVIFSGSSLQTIDGASNLTGTNGIDYFEIDNVNGVALKINVDVKNYLNLNNGIIFNTYGNDFIVNSNLATAVIGGGASSYVQGPLSKLVNNGDSFSFPVGDADRLGDVLISNTITSGAQLWSAEYFNHSAGNDGKDPNSVAGDVKFVSQNEYWRIQGPASSQANVTFRWDNISGVTPDDNFRVVEWQNTSDWNSLQNEAPNTSAKTVKTSNRIAFNEFTGEGNYFTFGSISIPAFTWLGGTSDWFLPSNWQGGVIPSGGTKITIEQKGVAPVISKASVANVNDLTIEHSGGLTLQPGAQMTVNGDLVTNGRLYIQNTADEPTSFIVLGTVTGNVSTTWSYNELYWYFIGHSISNPQMQTYRDMLATLGQNYALYDYQDGGSFVNLASGSHEFAADDELRGYQFKTVLPQSLTHTGALNNDPTYSRLTQDGWQIMANPYPSYYKIPQAALGTGDFAHSTGTVYVSVSATNATKQFETYNIFEGISSPAEFKGILAPSQAFYVRTADTSTPGTDQLLMSASNRFHDVNKTNLKSSQGVEEDILRIKMVNEFNIEDEAVIALRQKGDMGMSRMDSEQRFYNGTNISYIYSVVDGTKAVINTLPLQMLNKQVALGVKLKQGTHAIRIDGLNTLVDDYLITLEDKVVGASVEMDTNSEYTFTVDGDIEVNDRFVLHFGKADVSTDIDKDLSGDEANIQVYVENSSKLVVNCEWRGDKNVFLFTIDGRMVSNDEFKGELYSKDLNLNPGVYVVKVIGDTDQFEQKVFVK